MLDMWNSLNSSKQQNKDLNYWPLICVLTQKDFSVREMREFNKTVMQEIGQATQVHPDLSEAVTMYFAQVSFIAYWYCKVRLLLLYKVELSHHFSIFFCYLHKQDFF